MAEITDYARAIFYRDLSKLLSMPGHFARQAEIVPIIRSAIDKILAQFDAEDAIDALAFAEDIFTEWAGANVFLRKSDPFAGEYYIITNRLDVFRKKFLDMSEIHAMSTTIGGRFYADVFGGYRGASPLTAEERLNLAVPASDRIVSLQDNQIGELDGPIQGLVEQLEKDNGIPDRPGEKERLLGQVKAGRELIRAGKFRAYLLHATIIRALGELISRYKGSAIAMVAASLVDLLVKHALQVQ